MSKDLEGLGSILGRTGVPQGRHLRIVDTTLVSAKDQVEDDDLPGMIELGKDEADTSLLAVPSTSPIHPSISDRWRARAGTNVSESHRLVLPPPLPMQTTPVCEICKGAGYLRVDLPLGHRDFGKPRTCKCKIASTAQTLFGGANIPHELRECSFSSLAQLPNAQEQQMAALKIQAFLVARTQDEYRGYKRGLYLHGPWGRGKSGLAAAALRMVAEAGHSILFLPTVELFAMLYGAIGASQRLTRGYGDEEDRQEDTAAAKLLRLVLQVKWLVLDDLAAECANKMVIRELYRIIEGRRADGLYTIFTSNKDATDLEQFWRPDSQKAAAFDDCYRVIERLGEYCVAIPVGGRSLRQRM